MSNLALSEVDCGLTSLAESLQRRRSSFSTLLIALGAFVVFWSGIVLLTVSPCGYEGIDEFARRAVWLTLSWVILVVLLVGFANEIVDRVMDPWYGRLRWVQRAVCIAYLAHFVVGFFHLLGSLYHPACGKVRLAAAIWLGFEALVAVASLTLALVDPVLLRRRLMPSVHRGYSADDSHVASHSDLYSASDVYDDDVDDAASDIAHRIRIDSFDTDVYGRSASSSRRARSLMGDDSASNSDDDDPRAFFTPIAGSHRVEISAAEQRRMHDADADAERRHKHRRSRAHGTPGKHSRAGSRSKAQSLSRSHRPQPALMLHGPSLQLSAAPFVEDDELLYPAAYPGQQQAQHQSGAFGTFPPAVPAQNEPDLAELDAAGVSDPHLRQPPRDLVSAQYRQSKAPARKPGRASRRVVAVDEQPPLSSPVPTGAPSHTVDSSSATNIGSDTFPPAPRLGLSESPARSPLVIPPVVDAFEPALPPAAQEQPADAFRDLEPAANPLV